MSKEEQYYEGDEARPSGWRSCIIGTLACLCAAASCTSTDIHGDDSIRKPDNLEGSANAHYEQGLSLARTRRYLEAEEAYRKAIQLNPNFPKAHNELGICLVRRGGNTEAKSAFRRAIQLDPKYGKPHDNLANLLWGEGRIVEAEAMARRAVDLNPSDAVAQCNLGNFLVSETEEFAEAEVALRRAIELKPSFVTPYSILAALLAKQGRNVESEELNIDALSHGILLVH